MFTREDFQQLARTSLADPRFVAGYRGLHYSTYPQYAFQVPDSEQTLRITRAPKAAADNGLGFWLAAESVDFTPQRERYFAPYLADAAFEPLSEPALLKQIANCCAELIQPPPLPLISDQTFQGALLMYSLDTDLLVSLFAEYSQEYLHFYWTSTA